MKKLILVLIALLGLCWMVYPNRLNDRPTFLFFTAKGCIFCLKWQKEHQFDYEVNKRIKKMDFRVVSATVENRSLFEKYKVEGVPHFVVLDRDQTELGSISGYMPINEFVKSLDEITAKAMPVEGGKK